MSPRPRICSDDEVLKAAAHVVAKNPANWTLRDVGDQVGLCPATLVQRFGSKHDLEVRLTAYLREKGLSVIVDRDNHVEGLNVFLRLAALSRDPELSQLATGAVR